MRNVLAILVLTFLCTLWLSPTQAQEIETEILPAPTAPDLQLRDTKTREYEDAPKMRLRILDKVRAASRTYELDVGKTVSYSNLRIRPRACRKSSPLDEPESAAFLQIWEVKPDGTSEWVFSGWMFASSPSLSAMDHAVYDVTVLECKLPPAEEESEGQNQESNTESESPANDAETDNAESSID